MHIDIWSREEAMAIEEPSKHNRPSQTTQGRS